MNLNVFRERDSNLLNPSNCDYPNLNLEIRNSNSLHTSYSVLYNDSVMLSCYLERKLLPNPDGWSPPAAAAEATAAAVDDPDAAAGADD